MQTFPFKCPFQAYTLQFFSAPILNSGPTNCNVPNVVFFKKIIWLNYSFEWGKPTSLRTRFGTLWLEAFQSFLSSLG